MNVRSARPDDVRAIGDTSRAAGQDDDADPEYLRLLLDSATVCVVDGAHATIAGWGAVRDTPLGSMLTDLFVRPDQHGGGIGTALLRELWPDPEAPCRFTFSSQHANALPVYARAGLRPVWPLLYLSGPSDGLPPTPLTVDEVSLDDAAQFDGGRRRDYEFWASRDAHPVLVRDADRSIAVGAIRPAEVLHLVAELPHAADALVAALHAAGKSVSLCLPGPHPSTIPLLRSGFRITEFDVAMSTPDLELPTHWAYSPALG